MSSSPAPVAPARPVPRPGVLAIEAYVPGKSGAPGHSKVHKLSSNETPLGPSPKAVAAMRAEAAKLELYPEGTSRVLREAIAARYGLDPARIVCGAGSDELGGQQGLFPKARGWSNADSARKATRST